MVRLAILLAVPFFLIFGCVLQQEGGQAAAEKNLPGENGRPANASEPAAVKSVSAPATPQQPEAQGNFSYVMGSGAYAAAPSPLPAKGAPFSDPDFHVRITRITDKAEDGFIGPGIQNEYAKADPENSDGSLAILRGNAAAYYLYNLSSYGVVKQITVFDSCNQEPEPRWDASDPDVFYYVCNTELKGYDTASDVSATIHDFKKEFPSAAFISTKVEGDASLDRRYWAFLVEDPSYALLSVIAYDREEDRIVGQKAGGFPDSINWVGMSMSGEHVIVGYEDVAVYTDIFSRDFKTSVRLPVGSAGHGDAALAADGRDVYVYQNVRTDYISAADMATGAETALVRVPFDVNPDIGLHISGNSNRTPGWVLVSTYGSESPPPDGSHSWMDSQLFMLELKQGPRIWRIAHTQSYTSDDYDAEKNYFAEAFAAINTKGTRIYWGSNWRNYSADYTDAYVAALPAGWAEEMPAQDG
jgi:hypothetical protein